MKRPALATLPLFALLWLAFPALSRALEVRVDPRVELAAVMARLAGFEEYQGSGIARYDQAVEAHFGRFREHPSIATMKALREEVGLSYNMPVELALAIDPADWQLRLDPAQGNNGLDARWTPQAAQRFVEAARVFWQASDAAGFMTSQSPLHAEVERVLREALAPRIDLRWLARQYADAAERDVLVVAGLLTGPNSYGPGFVLADGRREDYAVLATPAIAEAEPIRYPEAQLASLMVHELHHPYVNPWVEAHATQLRPGASALFEAVAERMRAAAYGRWEYMLNESLVRAQVLRYYRWRGEEAGYWQNLHDDRARGFAWVDALAEALDASGERRFGPASEAAVLRFFAEWGSAPQARIAAEDARQAERIRLRQAQGPQIVEAWPPLGGGEVPPGEDVLRLRFDRPMAASVAVLGEPPEVIGAPRWEEDGTQLVIPVRFAPGAQHALRLNQEGEIGRGFVGVDGSWLIPRSWKFRVAEAADVPR